ncbi:ABC transporter permease [Candidatus Saccharibacteria bacterium]|nr:ABC transporter permease [Candidatus Saccharibacteria bacterium]
MNVVTRGVKNALRSPTRSGAIVLMLAISIALILVMLAARTSVTTKIAEVKAATASTITVSPAGIQGGMGGGDPLTADQVKTITSTEHVSGVISTLTDQLGTSETNLTPSTELGRFGQRMQRFEGTSGSSATPPTPPEGMGEGDSSTETRIPPQPRTLVTGTSDPNSLATNGGKLVLTSGETIDGTSEERIGLVGSNLAEKNSLKVGSTLTAYGQTITVKGIYKTGNDFADNGLILPLKTLQTLTDQSGSVLSATITVDSSENVASTVTALKEKLGDKADVTSAADRATSSLESLESIGNLTLVGVIGAAIAGGVIVLLSMIMIVRERRREIGVIKAIGGTNFKVITQFMVEAVTLTFIGAIVGIGLGVTTSGPLTKALVSSSESTTTSEQGRTPGGMRGGLGRPGAGGPIASARASVNDITGTLSPGVFAGAVGITFLIAIVGSAVPAWLISRVRPAEVLRTE